MAIASVLRKAIGSLLMCVTVATAAFAQITTGTVNGTIKDEQGLRVPGANVVLISEARKTRTAPAVTNATGDFVIPNLTPDTYTVEVTMSGFKILQRPGVAVSGGDRVGVGELTISLGGTSETVTVTAEAPLIQSQSGERSFRVTTTEVENLPIAGRNFSSLTALTPGVNGNTRLGGGGQNNIMMDGVSTMDTGNNGQLLQMTPEAIAEVKVLTGAYQAEYGRSSGLQITAVTKSGTNRLHGSVYDVMRNSAWDDNSWANKINGTPKNVSKQQDWGYSFGGPIGKPGGHNKLFTFYSQEYRPRTTANALRQIRVPTLEERAGNFTNSLDQTGKPIPALKQGSGFFNGQVLLNPADPRVQAGLNILKLYPNPNMTPAEVAAAGASYNLQFPAPQFKSSSTQPAIRGDYQISSSLRMTAKYTGQKGFRGTTPGTIPGFNDTFSAYPWVHAFATTVNYTLTPTTFLEATYGYSNRRLGGVVNSQFTNRFNTGLNLIPLIYPDANILPAGSYNLRVMQDVAPPFFVNGRAELAPFISNFGNRIGSSPPTLAYPSFLNTNPTQDFVVSLSKVQGRHTLKMGFYSNHSLKYQNLNQRTALPAQGDLSFANDGNNPNDTGFGFANIAIGAYTSYTQQSAIIEGKFLYNNLEAYVQDNWKVNRRWTLDYGVRFTHQQPQYDGNGQASNFFQDKYKLADAPVQYVLGCPGGGACAAPQAVDPRNPGVLLGAGTASLVGQLVPNTGNAANGLIREGQGIAKTNYLWPTLAIAPRFGTAYDIRGDQRLVLRSGFGLFFDRPDGDSIYYQSQNPPTSTNQTRRYGLLGDSAVKVASSGTPTLTTFRYNNPDLPSSLQWNIGVQMVLPFAASLDVSYVGQHSYSVLNQTGGNGPIDINSVDLGAAYLANNADPTKAGTACVGCVLNGQPVSILPGSQAYDPLLLRPFKGYNSINVETQAFERTYHSIQTSLVRRFRKSMSFGLNYTLGLSDTGTAGLGLRLQHAADGSYSVRADQAAFNENMKNLGLLRHVVKGNFVWDLPDIRSESSTLRMVGLIVNDWQLSGILTAGSGARYSITTAYQNGYTNINLTGSPNFAARTVITGDPGSGCSSDRFKQFNTAAFSGPQFGSTGLESGQNYMVGCPDHTLDLAIARNFKMGGGRMAQARVDLFNALNTVIFSTRQTALQLSGTPTTQSIFNSQYLADGTLDPTKVKTTSAGFGAVTGANAMRSVQVQIRFQF